MSICIRLSHMLQLCNRFIVITHDEYDISLPISKSRFITYSYISQKDDVFMGYKLVIYNYVTIPILWWL